MAARWLLSTIGKRGYVADYLREADPHAHIIGTGSTMYTPGFRRCHESFLVPEIGNPSYLDAVRSLIREHNINAVLSFTDPDVHRLSSIRKELADAGVACFFPGPQLATMGFDKYETYRWAVAQGINTPATYLDPDLAVRELGLPLVRKPRFGSASFGFEIITRRKGLVREGNETEMIYQELLEGEEINLELCGDLDGRLIGLSCWHKLDSRRGETELAVTTRRPDMIEYGRDLATVARIPGPSDVDVFDVAGVKFLVEFNMRFGGGYPVSHLAGANFPGLMTSIVHGESPSLSMPFAPDIVMMKELQPFGGNLEDVQQIFRISGSYRADE